MSSRFEKIIAGAIVAGALNFAGCTGVGGGSDDQPSSAFLISADAVDTDILELVFSQAIEVADAEAAVSKFTLRKNRRLHWLKAQVNSGFTTTCVSGNTITYPTTYTTYYGSPVFGTGSFYSCSYSAMYGSYNLTGATPNTSVYAGPAIGPIADVQSVDGESSKIRLILANPIVEDDDGPIPNNTGLLRLHFTDGAGSLTDAAGRRLRDFKPVPGMGGNVRDWTGSPVVLSAQAIDSTTVQLQFNEPMSTSDAAATAALFKVTNWTLPALSGYISLASLENAVMFQSSVSVAGSTLSLTSEGFLGTLTLDGPIGAAWDTDGYLQIQFLLPGDPDALKDTDGNGLYVFADSASKGNLVDYP